ncbi:hypothetical protein PL263_10425 [Methylomonas sp. EFPC3]|uniref:hypothetical protein n=1 Tax=Methylomonas sp. EFPC3 TaxID=3021710 RepID=UPI002416A3B5|nr:hypothetical protein [Methylomonas sp. EFPC3]WFP48528.1 hypothetical protein PL263_10425 [Methylomonas sp. EFPC3]
MAVGLLAVTAARRLAAGLVLMAAASGCPQAPVKTGCQGPRPMPQFTRVDCRMLPVPHQWYLPAERWADAATAPARSISRL